MPLFLMFALLLLTPALARPGLSTGVASRPLLAKLSNGQPDTLEIFAFKVKFRYEETDNSLTTGRGHFDSDGDTASANYSLDPQGSRASAAYWEKHLQFVDNYFRAASGGRLVVENRIFPSNQDAYTLDKFIIDYNRTARRQDEKSAEFDDARARDYMTFVRDAVTRALADPQGPFADSLPLSPNRKRVFLIIHAGASRLVDGGGLGTAGANTPGDFMDVFVPSDAWSLLRGVEGAAGDTAGLVLAGSPLDTLREIMVVSETASQDGLNWGINGILVHQVARQIGMPSTYDVVKGVSRLGWFDVMDFAGYNAGNGFLPVLPSAWLRAYMGWAPVREIHPGDSSITRVSLAAAGSGLGDEIIKIPINFKEYLLVENRQRAADTTGRITVSLDGGERTVPVDSLHLVFQDSICNPTTGACTPNARKARGIITGVSSYDASLPGSGLAVWHINEWYLAEGLRYGAVNFWGGDTFRDHQWGISLVEADGVLTIGKEFKDGLGHPAFDYGSGADLIPHIRTSSKDTLLSIGPGGYANTGSSNGGTAHFTLRAPLPTAARREKVYDAFRGDSLINFGAPVLDLEIVWGAPHQENSRWPLRTAPGNPRRNFATVSRPDLPAERALVVVSAQGLVQLLGARGDSLPLPDTLLVRDGRYDSVTTLLETVPSLDSAQNYSVYALGSALGRPVGVAASDSLFYSFHSSGLWRFSLTFDGLALGYVRDSLPLAGARLGPLVSGQGVWVVDSLALRRASPGGGAWSWEEEHLLESGREFHDMGLCVQADGDTLLVAVGTEGRLWAHSSRTRTLEALQWPADWSGRSPAVLGDLSTQVFRLACSDFNRDGNPDVFVLGSHGAGWMLDLHRNRTLAPARLFRRGWVPADDNATRIQERFHELSGIALGDLDGDGYPEAVFLGYNTVWAVDSAGVAKSGFPWRISAGVPEAALHADPLLVDLNGDGNPEILLATPSGLVHAVTGRGTTFRGTLATTPQSGALRPALGVWPMAMGSQGFGDLAPLHIALAEADSVAGPELYALGAEHIRAFRLPGAQARLPKATDGASYWLQSGGGDGRHNWLDPHGLGEAVAAVESSAITDFFLFPNPVKGGKVRARFELGAPATSAVLRLYDISGLEVFRHQVQGVGRGRNQWDDLDLSHLGSDVYSASLQVHFTNTTKVRWTRVGVVR